MIFVSFWWCTSRHSSFSLFNSECLSLFFSSWFKLRAYFEKLGSGLFVQSLVKLVNCWWDLQPLFQNLCFPLKLNINRPFNKSSQITFWLNSLSNSEISWSFF